MSSSKSPQNAHSCENDFLILDPSIRKNARKSLWVFALTFVMMVAEIYYGHLTQSMALSADGWHMATHVLAIGITYFTYRLATHPELVRNFNFGGGKILALGGFASGIILVAVFFLIGKQSVDRLFNPQAIAFNEAIRVAVLGLSVNVMSAFILHDYGMGHSHDHDGDHAHDDEHHHHHHAHEHKRDFNIRAAYIHVLADAITSVGAIVALLLGKYFQWRFLDPLIGIVGGLVILNWSWSLIKETGWELLDGHARQVDYQKLKRRIESEGSSILDLHIWQISPQVLACELVVSAKQTRGIEFYRHILEHEFAVKHSVIEERSINKI